MLGNLDKVLRRSTSLPVSIAEDPLLCVVMGTGKALEEKSKLSDIFALISFYGHRLKLKHYQDQG